MQGVSTESLCIESLLRVSAESLYREFLHVLAENVYKDSSQRVSKGGLYIKYLQRFHIERDSLQGIFARSPYRESMQRVFAESLYKEFLQRVSTGSPCRESL